MRARALVFAAAVVLSFTTSGCIKKMLTDGQIEATRRASGAFDSLGDFELARNAAQAGLVQFEGMHGLAPDNEDALYLLAKGWVGYAYGFVEDEVEIAEDMGDEDLADYHRRRAKMAYDRAVFYGLELLGHRASGFDQAKKTQQTISKWLADNFTSEDDADALFWTGYGWMARVNVMKNDEELGGALIAELFVGVAMMERAVAIDPGIEHYGGFAALAAYHARPFGEADQAKQFFEMVIAKTERKALITQLNYATKYACPRGEAPLYLQMLNEVIQTPDPDPGQRLTNAIAKRRAKRWLGKHRMKDQCGFDATAAAAPPASAPSAPAAPASPAPAPPAPANK
jgi:hypothetical protein